MINAYRAFLGGEFADARAAYQQLLARDQADADAWYGLGEAWFHDTTGANQAPHWTQAIRAFKRTLALDPDYALAYDHVQAMLSGAAAARPLLRAGGARFLRPHRRHRPAALLDSVTTVAAVRRARAEALATARSWVTTQPTTLRAHGAMVDAYIASGNYGGAMAEVDRFRQTAPVHPELPFVEARIRFASGEVDRAARELRDRARYGRAAGLPDLSRARPTVVGDIVAAANVFAYQGDLASAAKTIDLADQVRREVIQQPGRETESMGREGWRRMALGELYGATGVPTASLRQVWQSAAEAVRMAPADQRTHVAHSGASAAIGLFTGPAADSSALSEYRTLTGETLTKEVRALLALSRGDSAAARRALAEPDSLQSKMMYAYLPPPAGGPGVLSPRRLPGHAPIRCRISSRRRSGPADSTRAGACSAGSGCFARPRSSSSAAGRRRGRSTTMSLSQWRTADPALQPFVRQAQQGLARLGEAG